MAAVECAAADGRDGLVARHRPRARRHDAHRLAAQRPGGNGELIASELATNAVRASTGAGGFPVYVQGRMPLVRVAVLSDGRRAVIEVYDQAAGYPVMQEPGPDAEAGRGLLLVQALSSRWGWYPVPGQHFKCVWAELTPDDQPERHPFALRLPSFHRPQRCDPPVPPWDLRDRSSQGLRAATDLLPWRELVPSVTGSIAAFTGQHLIAVQTVLREDYWRELTQGFRRTPLDIFHVLLHVDSEILAERIKADKSDPWACQWRLEHISGYEKGRPWMESAANLVIDATHLPATDVADRIAAEAEKHIAAAA